MIQHGIIHGDLILTVDCSRRGLYIPPDGLDSVIGYCETNLDIRLYAGIRSNSRFNSGNYQYLDISQGFV